MGSRRDHAGAGDGDYRGFRSGKNFGESGADFAPPEGTEEEAGAGVGGRGDVSEPPPPVLFFLLLLPQTCHYQRKDSPVEALTLSPEPLRGGCQEEEGNARRAVKGKPGSIK